jgi:putative heme-binding domain-containing protein
MHAFRHLLLSFWAAILTAAIHPCLGDEPVALDPGTGALIGLLPQIDDPAAQLDILKGIRAGLTGQRRVAPPDNWESIYRDHLSRSESAEVRQVATLLALQFGDQSVREDLLRVVRNEAVPLAQRREALTALTEIRAAELQEVLAGLLAGSDLRADALRALSELGGPQTAAAILRAYPEFDLQEKRIAIDALSSDVDAAHALLKAVEEQAIPRTDLNAETIRRLQLLGDDAIDAAITAHWGTVRETPEAKALRIAALKAMLSAPTEREADLPHGRALFAKTCRQCHTLYGDGEKVGPEITGSNRGDLDYLLINVVDPNSTVGKDYQAWSVMTDAGKLYVGLIAEENDQVLTLRTETDTITIPKAEIEDRQLTPASMMPEGLFDQLSDSDLRDLVAYLRASRQVPLLATEGTAGLFYDGQELSHWTQHGGDWRVVDGAIHGNSDAATSAEALLVSDLLLDDCVVEMEVKLAAAQGSAGIALVPWNEGTDLDAVRSLPAAPVALELRAEGDISVSQALIDAEVSRMPQASTEGCHAVRIDRSKGQFTLSVDGREIVAGSADALPRFRVAFVLDDLTGEFLIRRLRLRIPQEGPDTK